LRVFALRRHTEDEARAYSASLLIADAVEVAVSPKRKIDTGWDAFGSRELVQ
jgi:hypothetical protein